MEEKELLELVKQAAHEMTVEEWMEKNAWNPIKYLGIGAKQLRGLWRTAGKKGIKDTLGLMGRNWKALAPAATTIGAGAAGIGGVGYLGGRMARRPRR